MRPPLTAQEFLRRLRAVAPLTQGIEILGQMSFITDVDGHILYANPATERATGFSRSEMLGRNPADLWGGNMPEEFYKNFWKTVKIDKKPFAAEMHNRRKDGAMQWQEMFVTPILEEDGEVGFFVAVEPDISERKEREKFREEFVSILGHQLKNPLTAVNWTLELLLERNGLRPDQKTSLLDIYEGSRSMTELIEDLLTISRLGQAPAEMDEIDLAKEISEIIQLAKHRHPHIAVVFDPPAPIPFKTNRVLAIQVFSNLISNAFEYADRGKPYVHVALTSQKTLVRLEIENNGLAIREDAHEKIFSRFFRTDEAKAYKANGTGLGLFIVKMICDAFGWRVGFESPGPSGAGAMFFVELPRD